MKAALIGLIAAGLLLAGCAGQPSAAPAATNKVDLPRSYKFAPAAIQVSAGTTVTWTNDDQFTHSVRFAATGENHVIKPGESTTYTFATPGTFAYDCQFHPQDMKGSVVVTAP